MTGPGTMDPTTEACELRRELEQLHDRKLAEDLAHSETVYHLRQALTSLRWWAVASLVWMVREASEPAINAWAYPASWAFKLTHMWGYPGALIGLFAVAAVLIAPLPVFLAAVPASTIARKAEGLAVLGLGLAGVGYVFLYTLALRIDMPHVRAAYLWGAALLLVHALLLACWHNSRLVREADHNTGGDECGDSVI